MYCLKTLAIAFLFDIDGCCLICGLRFWREIDIVIELSCAMVWDERFFSIERKF